MILERLIGVVQPTPGTGFKFHQPVPSASWSGKLGTLLNDLQDNIAFWVLTGAGIIALFSLGVMLVGFGSGNKRRGMAALGTFGVCAAVIVVLGTYAGIFQSISDSVSKA